MTRSVSCHAHANCELCDQLERDLAAAGKLNRWIRHDTECPALWSDKNVFGEPRDNQCTCGLDAARAAGEKP